MNELHSQGFCGVNLTVPHKELAMRIIDACDSVAKRVGAINTVQVHNSGRLEGFNTDVFGFTQNLQSAGFDMKETARCDYWRGGAARAAVIALQDMQIPDIRVINRTRSRADDLAAQLGSRISVYDWNDTTAFDDISLLVNATSLGLKGQPELDRDLTGLPPDATVTDMVYVPLMTGLLQQAKRRGHPVIDGLGMLLHQARPAFSLFFGQDPEVTPALRDYVVAGQG